MSSTTTKSRKRRPNPESRFPYTHRIQAFEMALDNGLHLVRDNHHLWAIRESDKVQVWLCNSPSYDGLWKEACEVMRSHGFDVNTLPYSVGETDKVVNLYDPATGETRKVSKDDLRSRRGE